MVFESDLEQCSSNPWFEIVSSGIHSNSSSNLYTVIELFLLFYAQALNKEEVRSSTLFLYGRCNMSSMLAEQQLQSFVFTQDVFRHIIKCRTPVF